MSAPTKSSSPSPVHHGLLRMLDNFLQEKNIKWLLASGVAILLGSSVMLVNSHWDSLGQAWKYLILVGYVGVIHAAGQWTYKGLSLRKTGTVLMGLTVLLIPLSFITWHLFVMGNWLSPLAGAMSRPVAILFLVGNVIFACVASNRVFNHFLRGHQRTFSICYLVLCVAGAVTPTLAATGSLGITVGVSLAMWSVFIVGAVKVNRHVFWLVETHQAPRVYGFFPVLLLGAQFLGLFAVNFAGQIPIQWLGLALVQVAVPVLLTADTVAKTFKQRTGELVRQLPWAVAVPLALGILACLGGLALAMSPLFAGESPYAVVPTAALCAVAMGVAAQRTQHKAFVWMMSCCVLVTYNFSPLFFRELAGQVASTGAQLVNEAKLPYAFYGLTYLPLLIGLTATAALLGRRQKGTFAGPLKQLSIALPLLLIAAAFTQPALGMYPVFLVAGTMSALLLVQSRVYRNRTLAAAGLGSLLLSAASIGAFLNQIFGTELTAFVGLGAVQLLGTVLTLLGPKLDTRLRVWCRTEGGAASTRLASLDTLCQSSGLLVMVGAAGAWLGLVASVQAPAWQVYGSAAFTMALLLWHCLTYQHALMSTWAYAFASAVLLSATHHAQLSWPQCVNFATGIWLTQWIIDYVLAKSPDSRAARAFWRLNRLTATVGLMSVMGLYYTPQYLGSLVGATDLVPGFCEHLISAGLTLWGFDAARRWRSRSLGSVVYGFGMLVATHVALTWVDTVGQPSSLFVLWAAIPTATVPLIAWLQKQQSPGTRVLSDCLTKMGVIVLVAVTTLTIVNPLTFGRIAGALGVITLFSLGRLRSTPWMRTAAIAIGTWHSITLALQLASYDRLTVMLTTAPGLAAAVVGAVSATALLGWQRCSVTDPVSKTIAVFQRTVLRTVSLVAMCVLTVTAVSGQPMLRPMGIVLGLANFAIIGWTECRAAIASGIKARAWATIFIGGWALLFTTLALAIPVHCLPAAMLGLVSAFTFELGRTWLRLRAPTHVFTTPLAQTANGLAIAAAALAAACPTTAVTCLVVLFAAGMFFWKGMNSDAGRFVRIRLFAVSAFLTNATLWLVWANMQLTDPQLYLIPGGATLLIFVEVLRRDLPFKVANALRYASAMCILVSPTFDLVGASWAPMLTLMIAAVAMIVLSMALRARALLYVGTGFLAADLVAMAVRGCWDQPSLLWIAGIVVGGAVVALAALAENGRERLLQRMRMLSSRLEAWD